MCGLLPEAGLDLYYHEIVPILRAGLVCPILQRSKQNEGTQLVCVDSNPGRGLGPSQDKNLFLSLQSENWALSQIMQWTPWPGSVWQFLAQQPGQGIWIDRLTDATPSQGAVASMEIEGNLVSED